MSNDKVITAPKIVIMGIGGAGCNAVNNMIQSGLKGVHFVVANTDAQSLNASLCENRIQLGATLTSGLGAGSSPEIGYQAAEESRKEIEEFIVGANMLFLASGMGGGTGTGATPIIAKIAKELGILTVGVVTKPFHFEQKNRLSIAEAGLIELDKYCNTLIVISNQKLFGIANEDTTFANAFKMADNVLVSGVKCVTNLITNPGIVNLDFADVKSVMSSFGRAIMGEGEASGEKRAIKAAEDAITNPLLEHSSIAGANSILINITSGPDITLFEVNDIMARITEELGEEAISKFGSVIDDEMEGIIRVSIVATGIKMENAEQKNNPIELEDNISEDEMDNLNNQTQNLYTTTPYTNEYFEEKSQNTTPVNHLHKSIDQNSQINDETEISFNDLEEDNNFADSELENKSFFIPSPSRRINAKKTSSATYNNNNGLFSKIFSKKN